ncbi:hypothetical protein VB780_24560 [Leptolyngbya sp. CCNP1308]|uniref:hypothetical protein n=1 Tax=Leptolyngbya sp. CCNP1308 TaxID=3110255 RepID=UPI002B20A3D8|nr:hypothetical protein [Leptolyngbya sp. CCNP1308]MEA5451772.1 hypothetical protein [Leptolyngbya sp. CCNP1308]
MLDIGRPPEFIDGLTVFFDHADEQRRYGLADAPRLVANPHPQLSLWLFRGEDNQGGLLQFEAELAPSAEQMETVRTRLSQSGEPPLLLPPHWRTGEVRLTGWLDGDELAPLSLSMGMPSLLGNPLALVAARLDAAGAALADAALRGNALPTVVVFDLEMLGLAGPLGIEAEADLHAIHDRLTVEGALTTPYGAARLAITWEELVRDNLIRLRVVDESGDVESQRAEALRRVGQELVARMFSPFPPAEKPPLLNDDSVAALELSFRLTARREELETTSRWSFLERRAMPIRHYAAASLVDLLGTQAAVEVIHWVDLTPAPMQMTVRGERELARLGLSAVEVELSWSPEKSVGIAGDRPIDHTIILTDDRFEERFTLSRVPTEPVQYRVRSHPDPEQTHVPSQTTDWLRAEGGLIQISPRRLFPPRVVTAIASPIDFAWLDHVELVFNSPAETARSLRLDTHTRSADLFLPAVGAGPVWFSAHWRGRPGEPSYVEPPRLLEADILILDSPFGASLELLLVPLPLEEVATLVVELQTGPENGSGSFEHQRAVTWDGGDRTPQRVGLRRLRGTPRHYRYRVSLMHHSGRLEQQPWSYSDATTLVIGATEPMATYTTEVVLLEGGPAQRDSFAIELILASGEHQTRQILQQDQDQTELILVVPATAPPPELTVHEFMNSGHVHESHWPQPAALTVLPTPSLIHP